MLNSPALSQAKDMAAAAGPRLAIWGHFYIFQF